MQDTRALQSSQNLSSWRAWQDEAFRRSGFLAISAGAFPLLTTLFVVACTLYARAVGRVEVATVLAGAGVFLAATLGLTGFGLLRLNAWNRAHPWTPPA